VRTRQPNHDTTTTAASSCADAATATTAAVIASDLVVGVGTKVLLDRGTAVRCEARQQTEIILQWMLHIPTLTAHYYIVHTAFCSIIQPF
jgi:hypothetical protein